MAGAGAGKFWRNSSKLPEDTVFVSVLAGITLDGLSKGVRFYVQNKFLTTKK
jgi:hypothetical protein